MLCQVCKKNDATVHYTELANNKVTEIHLCEKCAMQKGVSLKPELLLADLMAGLVEAGRSGGKKSEKRCSNCGLSYSEFRSSGRLGCARCYEAFKDSLKSLIEKIHGSSVHIGKFARPTDGELDKGLMLRKLRNRLQKLVEREEFEEAARVRDEIDRVEKKN